MRLSDPLVSFMEKKTVNRRETKPRVPTTPGPVHLNKNRTEKDIIRSFGWEYEADTLIRNNGKVRHEFGPH